MANKKGQPSEAIGYLYMLSINVYNQWNIYIHKYAVGRKNMYL